MKDIISNRIKRIEEILRREKVVCMVASHDEKGFHWNGNTYPDQESLGQAVRLVAGDYDERPLVIISQIRLSENLR